MKRYFYITIAVIFPFIVSGCFKDLGNYDYIEINDIVIGDKGFDKPYDIRRDYEPFSIDPEITFTKDPEGNGSYSYEWVAVGQNKLRGERFVIGTERNLHCDRVMLDAEQYILYLKVKDLSTDIVFSKDVELTVKATTTEGWLLAGEDENGKGQVDMISISSEILFPTNLLKLENGLELSPIRLAWISNDDYADDDRLFTGTSDGSYRFDRETFKGNPNTSIKSSFVFAPDLGAYSMTACYDIDNKRHIIIVDNKGYEMKDGIIGNTFCTYDNLTDFDIADEFIYNLSFEPGHARLMCIFYDIQQKMFCNMSATVGTQSQLDNTLWNWSTKDVAENGLDMIATVNSFFNKGLGAAIMKDPLTGKHYIYEITVPPYGYPSKEGRYQVNDGTATGFATSPSYIISTFQGYMIYASGNRLYGYSYTSEPQRIELLYEFPANVTCIKADYESDYSTRDKDYFFVATYDDSKPRSGAVYKLQVIDDPDIMKVNLLETYEKNFLKIHSMCYKAF